MRVRKGDTVKIISGNDRGRQGKVLAVFPEEGRIAVDGLNMKKKHVRPRTRGQKGELVRVPAPFPVARAMPVCSKCGKATRTKNEMRDGKKMRVCRKCGAEI